MSKANRRRTRKRKHIAQRDSGAFFVRPTKRPTVRVEKSAGLSRIAKEVRAEFGEANRRKPVRSSITGIENHIQ